MKSRIVCLSLLVPLVLLLSSVQAERRHVIEIYNKNHHVTKNVSPSTDPPSTLDSSASNKRTSRNSRHIPTEVSTQDNEVSSSKESRTKVSQNSHDSRIKGLKTGIDYVHEPESTYTLSRRKSKSLKRKQQQQQQQQYQAVPQAHHQEQQQQQQQQQISQSPHRFQHQYHPDLQKIQPHQQEQQQQQQREQQQQAQQQQQQQAQQQQQQQQAQQQQQQQQQSLRTQSNKQAGVTNKFRDYIATPSFQQEPKTPLPIRVLSVPTGTSQRSSNSQSGRIALGSSPKDTIIEAPLYNFVSGGQLQLQPNVQVHYSDYRHRQALPEPNYASHVQYLPEVQNPHVPFPAPVMNVPQMHQISAVASPMIVSQQHVPMVHQPMHQLPLVQHHLSYHQQSHLVPEPEAPKQAGHEGGAPLTEEELHAEIMEHFYNDEFFKGFFDTGPPALSMLPTPPTPPAPAQPVHQQDSLQVMEQQSGYNSNPHNQAPYGFVQNSGFKMAAPTLYNVQTDPRINYVQAQPILAIPKTVYGVNAAYPQSSVAYQAPFPAVRYMDELKAAYSNNIEKSVNVSSSSSSSTGERTKNPESSSATSSEKKEFPITIQKKMLGQENLHGKPWGEKTVISYEDPKDPNNFVQVSEMRMSVNRPLDPESASTHLNELMNTFGSGSHNQANRSFDDDASAAAAAAKK